MDGGRSTTTRRSYEIKEKRRIVQRVDDLMSSGFTRHCACLKVGIPALYHRRWKKLINKVDDVNATDTFVSYNTHGTSRKLHQGRKSFLSTIEPQL